MGYFIVTVIFLFTFGMAYRQPLFFRIICPLYLILLFLLHVYYEGLPFESIYKHKTLYIEPWKKDLPATFKMLAILTAFVLLFWFPINIFLTSLSEALVKMKQMVIGAFPLILLCFLRDKEKIKIRISPEKLNIYYSDVYKRHKAQWYFYLRIHVNEIKNIERIHFPEFYTDFDKNLTNRKLDGIYNYVITCSHESAVDGIDITLLNGKHIVFETDDVENCIRVLKNVSGLH